MKNYKLMALVPLFMLIGCKHQDHKNVVVAISTNSTEQGLLLKDVKTGQERFYSFSLDYNDKYLEVGDTVLIITGGTFKSDDYYQKNLILYPGNIGFYYNNDLVCARQQIERLNQIKQNIMKTR